MCAQRVTEHRCIAVDRWSLEYFTRYVRENREELATVIWKDTPPQHFDYENGYYWYYLSHDLGRACMHACPD